MGLEVDFFYSPEYVTWDYASGGGVTVSASYPRPDLTLTIADRAESSGDIVIIGKSLDHMLALREYRHFRRHIVVVPGDHYTSKVVGVLQWRKSGLRFEGYSRNPVLLRTWGNRFVHSVNRCARGRSAVLQGLDARLIGRVPGDGTWFRTRPPEGFLAERPGIDPDLTPESFYPVHPGILAGLFYCPMYPGDAKHVLLDPSECSDEEHASRRRRLALVVAYYLRWLVWPPHGWHLPPDEGKHMIPRYAFTDERRLPTAPRDRLIQLVFKETSAVVTEETLLDHLVNAGVITWDRIKDLVSRMNQLAPLDWTKPAKANRYIVPQGLARPIRYVLATP